MTKTLLFVALLFISDRNYGQKQGQQLADSLISELPRMKEDSNKVLVLKIMSVVLSEIDAEIGIKYGQSSLELANKIGHTKGKARALNTIGVNYLRQSQYDIALIYIQQAIAINVALDNQMDLGNNFTNLGLVYQEKEDYVNALKYDFDALAIFEKIKEELRYARVLDNIGIIYQEVDNYQKALVYQEKALSVFQRLNVKSDFALGLINTSISLRNLGHFLKALEYAKKGLIINEELGEKYGTALGLTHIGTTYRKLNEYSLAQKNLHKSLAISTNINAKKLTAFNYEQFGELYFLAAEKATSGAKWRAYDTALLYFNKSISCNEALNHGAKKDIYTPTLQRLYKRVGLIYFAQQNYTKAAAYLREYSIVKDSIDKNNSLGKVVQLYEDFEAEKKNTEISALQKDKKIRTLQLEKERNTRNYLIAGFAIFLAFSGLSFYNYNRRKKLSFSTRVSETEMKALRAQMNPHFIFNSLNTIHSFVQANENKAASEYLLKFSTLTREILENSQHQLISLADELKTLETYIALESMRLNRKLEYEIVIDPSLEKENVMVPPLILQPFIENAVLHGLQQKEEGKIKIVVNKQGEMLNCLIEDNGMGLQPPANAKKGGYAMKKESLGMKLTEQRIDIMNKLKKAKGSVTVSNKVNEDSNIAGVRVELVLPLEQRF